MLDDVLHHQEIVGKALHPDDGELVLQPRARDGGDGAVAPRRPFVGHGLELLERIGGLGVAGRDDAIADGNAIAAAFRQLAGAIESVRNIGEMAGELGRGFEPGVWRRRDDGTTGGREFWRRNLPVSPSSRPPVCRKRRVSRNRHHQPVPSPILRMGEHRAVGDDRRNTQPTRRGEHRVASGAGTELGVEVFRTAGGDEALEKGNAGGQEQGAVPIVRELGAKAVRRSGGRMPSACPPVRPSAPPMHRTDRATDRSPSPLVHREGHALLVVLHEMRAKDRPDPRLFGSALELDRAVDSVGIGTGKNGKASRGRRRDQRLGTGDALAQREP